MKRVILLMLFAVVYAVAQGNTALFYDSGNRVQYMCSTGTVQVPVTTTWQRSDSTLTNIVVSSNVATFTIGSAHNAYSGMRVTVAGSTAGIIDGTFTVQVVGSTTTFTAPITATNGTYTTSTIVVTTPDPLLNVAVWSIDVLVYNGSGYNTGIFKAGNGKSLAHTMKCSDRTSY